jgi:hypothetical protein
MDGGVDSPDPGGMSPEDLATVLKIALGARGCVGLELTIYDPTLDPAGEGAELLVNLLKIRQTHYYVRLATLIEDVSSHKRSSIELSPEGCKGQRCRKGAPSCTSALVSD